MPKVVQSIYKVMKLSVPLDRPLILGNSKAFFTQKKLQFFKVTGRPGQISDDGHFLAPQVGLIDLHQATYLVISTNCKDDSDNEELSARELSDTATAFISLYFGKRSAEQYVGMNVIPEEGKFTLISHPERNPMAYEQRNIDDTIFKNAQETVNKYWNQSEATRAVYDLAMRWYLKGRREEFHTDAYLNFWISLEVLFGQWKDMDKHIAKELEKLIPGNFKSNEIKSKLKLGQLLGLRGEIVHKGKSVLQTPQEMDKLILLREINEEILRNRLGCSLRDRFSKFFSI